MSEYDHELNRRIEQQLKQQTAIVLVNDCLKGNASTMAIASNQVRLVRHWIDGRSSMVHKHVTVHLLFFYSRQNQRSTIKHPISTRTVLD